jgi:hypothetical protein
MLVSSECEGYIATLETSATTQFDCLCVCDAAAEQTDLLLIIGRPLRWLVTHRDKHLARSPVIPKSTFVIQSLRKFSASVSHRQPCPS